MVYLPVLAESTGLSTQGVTDLMSVVSTVISTIVAQPLLLALVSIPLVVGSIKVFKKLTKIR